jgi:hypothetical protein
MTLLFVVVLEVTVDLPLYKSRYNKCRLNIMGNTAPILAGANTKDALINSATATDSLSNTTVVLNNERSIIATDNIITIINENNDINNTERSIVNGSHSRTRLLLILILIMKM